MIHSAEVDVLEGEASAAAAGVHLAGKGALIGGESAAGGHGAGPSLHVAT